MLHSNGHGKGGVGMNVNTRMLELSQKWNNTHPNATEQERKSAYDKIAGHVVREMVRGYEMPLNLDALV